MLFSKRKIKECSKRFKEYYRSMFLCEKIRLMKALRALSSTAALLRLWSPLTSLLRLPFLPRLWYFLGPLRSIFPLWSLRKFWFIFTSFSQKGSFKDMLSYYRKFYFTLHSLFLHIRDLDWRYYVKNMRNSDKCKRNQLIKFDE